MSTTLLNIRFKRYLPEDYSLVASWATSRGLRPFSPGIFSDTGWITYLNDRPICVAWLYLSNSKLASIAWTISPIDSSKEDRDKCLPILIESLTNYAKMKGATHVFTTCKNASLINHYKNQAFIPVETGVTDFIKEI